MAAAKKKSPFFSPKKILLKKLRSSRRAAQTQAQSFGRASFGRNAVNLSRPSGLHGLSRLCGRGAREIWKKSRCQRDLVKSRPFYLQKKLKCLFFCPAQTKNQTPCRRCCRSFQIKQSSLNYHAVKEQYELKFLVATPSKRSIVIQIKDKSLLS